MPSCKPCDVRWADDGPCWCCGDTSTIPTVSVDPDPLSDEEDMYWAWGIWG